MLYNILQNSKVCITFTTVLTVKQHIMSGEKTYIGTYKVVKIFRVSNRRTVLARGLNRDEAKAMVNRYPDSTRSMVVFFKQFTSDKYYI